MLDPLPVPTGWRGVVEDTIARLEAQDTLFARLALPGWYDELRRIKEVEPTPDEEPQGF